MLHMSHDGDCLRLTVCHARVSLFASPALVADFLLHIAVSRNTSYCTLTGYCSFIRQFLRLVTDFDPASCPMLCQLMYSFRPSQPVTARRISQWYSTLVLSVPCCRECRDGLLPLPILTVKTVVLLALASGERRHALAALTLPPSLHPNVCESRASAGMSGTHLTILPGHRSVTSLGSSNISPYIS